MSKVRKISLPSIIKRGHQTAREKALSELDMSDTSAIKKKEDL